MPASYSFTRSREQMAQTILSKLGIVGAGETITAYDYALVYEAIDFRLKELHAIGILWYQVDPAAANVALVSGTATASAPTDCLFPISASLRIGDEDTPLEIIGHRQYQDIPNKLDQSEPEQVLFSAGVLRFWPVPNDNYTVKLTYEAIAADTAAATAPDISVSMMRAFSTIVASDLADHYQKGEQTVVRLMAEADQAMRTIRALNAERSDAGTTTVDYF